MTYGTVRYLHYEGDFSKCCRYEFRLFKPLNLKTSVMPNEPLLLGNLIKKIITMSFV